MEEDRISELGDAILLHILCSINIKEAVQTSILSKRWKSLWTSMPHLNFNFTSMALHSGIHVDGNPFDSQTFMLTFTNFVTQFLSHRDHTSAIRKFQISGSKLIGTDPRSVSEWVDYAIYHGVHRLDLDVLISYTLLSKLPDAFSGCQTLRELRLRRPGYGFVVPKPLVLPNLNSLYLECFTFKDDHGEEEDEYNFPGEPFSGFPNLEKLSLHHCRVDNLVILSSKLKILEFYFKGILVDEKAKMKQISTPMLTSLRYEGHFPLECPKVDFSCLEEVYLNIYTNLIPYYRGNKEIFLNSVKMLQQLGNAKAVTLTLDTIEVLETDPLFLEQSPSPFPNMECLKVTKGCVEIDTVVHSVINYLIKGSLYEESVVVEIPKGVSVIEKRIPNNPPDEYSDDELGFRCLFS